MTWRDVLDGSKARQLTLPQAAKLARELRYKFIAWNGGIYFVDIEEIGETGLTVEDLVNEKADKPNGKTK